MEIFDLLRKQQESARTHRDEMWTQYWRLHPTVTTGRDLVVQNAIDRLTQALEKNPGQLKLVVQAVIRDLSG